MIRLLTTQPHGPTPPPGPSSEELVDMILEASSDAGELVQAHMSRQ